MPKDKKTWHDFKSLWNLHRESIDNYLKLVRNNDAFTISEQLNFYIPVELLVPRDMHDELCMATFRNKLFDICEARNNNVELQTSAKANQKGYFEDFKALMKKKEQFIRIQYRMENQ